MSRKSPKHVEEPIESDAPKPASSAVAPGADVGADAAVGRTRRRGAGAECPSCHGTDTFMEQSKIYPSFLRVRYLVCGKCAHRWKG